MSKHPLLYKLLNRNISRRQMLTYVVSLFLGLLIVFVGVRFLSDIRAAGRAPGTSGYHVISKRIGGAGLFGAEATPFDEGEIAGFTVLPGVKRVGRFSRADFDVNARLDASMGGMSTALFLESVPASFLDVDTACFRFDPSDATVPVVIPRDYLSLYNFGFAPSRGLPQITPSMLSLVPLRLSVSGNGLQSEFKARIAGCSERINTIAVPEEFLSWANSVYGHDGQSPAPSRLIVETEPSADLTDYLAEHDYEVSAGMLADSRVSRMLTVAASVVMAVGAVIMVLAAFILTVSIHLLLYKNRLTLHRLMLLGYTPRQVMRPYVARVTLVNAVVSALALIAALVLRSVWIGPLRAIGLDGGPWWPVVSVAATIFLSLTAANISTVRSNVRSAFRQQD